MGKVGAWVDKNKLRILEQALHKGESISEKHSWTIYFLVDLKVVYIITYAYITIVNLISSTANSEASSDTESMMLFNVTLSPELRDVEVDSISDSILWNCRRQSVTSYYYRFLYCVLIVGMGTVLVGYFVIKLVALITVSCFCKNCSCPCVLSEYGLVKLWQIAVLEELKVKGGELLSQSQQQQQEHQAATVNEPTLAAAHEIETVKSTQSSKFGLKDYQLLLKKDMTSDTFKDLRRRSKWSNYCRQIIPAFLLFLSVITLGLSFLSYDLHPLACMVRPAEDFISYNATTKRVDLEFSNHLRDFQKSAAIIVIVLSVVFLLIALSFHHLSNKVIEYLKAEVKKCINETRTTKQFGSKREDTITGQHLATTEL